MSDATMQIKTVRNRVEFKEPVSIKEYLDLQASTYDKDEDIFTKTMKKTLDSGDYTQLAP